MKIKVGTDLILAAEKTSVYRKGRAAGRRKCIYIYVSLVAVCI